MMTLLGPWTLGSKLISRDRLSLGGWSKGRRGQELAVCAPDSGTARRSGARPFAADFYLGRVMRLLVYRGRTGRIDHGLHA